MSLSKNSKYSAQDFVTLKNNIKTEIQRRSNTKSSGSLSAYATSTYDYGTDKPATNGSMVVSQVTKLLTPMNAIKNQGITTPTAGSATKSVSVLQTNLSTYSAIPVTSSSHGCSANCSGLCYTACYSTCSSCSGSCTGCRGCTNCTSCSGCSGCGSSCRDDCEGGCSSDCSGRCAGCQNSI